MALNDSSLSFFSSALKSSRFRIKDLSDKVSTDTKEIAEGINLDFDETGEVVGMDIDNASKKINLEELTINKVPARARHVGRPKDNAFHITLLMHGKY